MTPPDTHQQPTPSTAEMRRHDLGPPIAVKEPNELAESYCIEVVPRE